MALLKKILLLSSLTVFFINFSYSQSLTAKEAVAYYNEGVRAQQKGDFNAALNAYQKALLLSYQYNKFIMNNQAVIYAQTGNFKKAEALFQEVIAMDPYYLPAKINLGLIYDSSRDRCEALEYWADMFEIDKRKPKKFVADKEQPVPK
jgi:tetratricopeptide (TPR) repeat protein